MQVINSNSYCHHQKRKETKGKEKEKNKSKSMRWLMTLFCSDVFLPFPIVETCIGVLLSKNPNKGVKQGL